MLRLISFIFLYFTSFYIQAATCTYRLVSSPGSYSTMEELCKAKEGPDSKPIKFGSGYKCSLYGNEISVPIGCPASTCTAGSTIVKSGSYTISNWKDLTELDSLTAQLDPKFRGTTVCSNSCLHEFEFTTNLSGDVDNPPLVMTGSYISTATSCSSPTSGPTGTLTGTGNSGGNTGGGDTGGGDTGGGDTGGGNTGGGTGSDLEIISAIRTQGQAIKDAIYTTGSAATANYFDFKNSFFDRLSGISDYINAIFNRQGDTNQILNSIDSKMSSETSPEINDKLTETNAFISDLVDSIVEATELLTTLFSSEGAEQYDELGAESSDTRYTGELQKSEGLFTKLGNLMNFTDKQCVSDLEVDTGFFGVIKIPLSEWCVLMAIIKLFLHLYVLLLCLRMIQKTISEI